MATKKTAAEEEKEVKTPETVAEVPEEIDPWDIEVEMIVPRKPRGEDQQYYVCVNDRRFLIPANGLVQKMPRPIADVLRASLEAEAVADQFADHIPNRSGEQPNIHAI